MLKNRGADLFAILSNVLSINWFLWLSEGRTSCVPLIALVISAIFLKLLTELYYQGNAAKIEAYALLESIFVMLCNLRTSIVRYCL